MQRASTVSQFLRIFVTSAALVAGTIGCGGSSGTPSGTAGSGGGGAGGGGTSGGTACSLDDVNKIINATAVPYTGCVVINSCHDNQGSAAGLDLTTAGWQTKLVGQNPVANKGSVQANYSQCVGHGPYLVAGSKPAAGLFIDKLNPSAAAPCGAHMPNLGAMLSAAQFQCFQSYLTTLTSP